MRQTKSAWFVLPDRCLVRRPPGKKSRHVVLKLCSRAPDDADGSQRGVLLEHIVAKRDLRRRKGLPGYRLARKSHWGDLWPAQYQDREQTRTQKHD